jgi:hypothetical protein
MGKSKISMTFEELVASYNAWWTDYKADPSASVDYDAADYDDTNYGVDSANTFLKYLNKIQGE